MGIRISDSNDSFYYLQLSDSVNRPTKCRFEKKLSGGTLAFAIITRSHTVSITAIGPYLPEVLGLAAGGIGSAAYGARLVTALSMNRLVQLIAGLLAAIGCLLLVEALSPLHHAELLPDSPAIHAAVGAAFGIGIGLVSSVLGVAGGELLIPTLIFVFGADIRTAGSASILISLGVVAIGLWRYWRIGATPKRRG